MKAGIYSPYWDTLGGGERYCASIAKYLLEHRYQVDIFSTFPHLITKLKKRFNIDVTNARILPSAESIFNQPGKIFEKWELTRGYDLIFYLSDGSLPFLFAKKNIIHFQVPFKNVGGGKLVNRLKLKNIHHVICNSKFTKKVIDEEFKINSQVVYPGVVPIYVTQKKQNLILSVGRFDNLMQSKRQDVLIEAFEKLNNPQWKLVIVGGVLHGKEYVNQLKSKSQGLNVDIITDATHEQLSKLYARSKIFWHAAGYNLDINLHPQKAEHFGISTVEAMSAGCIPIVYNGGGLKEIITPSKNGFLWSTIDELVEKTKRVIKKQDKSIIEQAKTRSHQFSQEKFYASLQKIIA